MTFSSTTIVVLLANGLSAVVAAMMLMLVLWQAPRQRMNQLFAFTMLMQFAYSVANGFGRFIDEFNLDPRVATYVAISFFGLYVIAVFFFASEFAQQRTPTIRVMRWMGAGLALVVFYALWNDRLIRDVYPTAHGDGSYNADWAPLGMGVVAMIMGYLVIATIVLYRLPDERGRSLWPGPLLLVLGNVSNFVLWPLLHLPLQSVILAAGALALGIPVLRYELFNPLAQAHIKLGERNAELREAYQMKNRFLANISHELRTPLNTIIGYTELMLDGAYGALNDTQRDRLEKVVRNGRNLLNLINDVLDLSHMETGRVALDCRMVHTPELLDDVLVIIEPLAAQKGLTVIRDYDDVPDVYADDMRLRQIITNIAANAVKFTHAGTITLRARAMNGAVRFEIADTGIGIPREAYSRVFAEFEQIDSSTTRRYEGTGLGMAISKRLVEMHGGTIWLESTPGQGTTFFVTIPTVPPDESPAAAPEPDPSHAEPDAAPEASPQVATRPQ